MNYFEQLSPDIMNYMINYKDDFNVLDKAELNNYHGKFLLSVRTTGTNLLKFDKDYILAVALPIFNNPAREVLPDFSFFESIVEPYLFGNELFFYGHDDHAKQISREHALNIYHDWLPRIQQILKANAEMAVLQNMNGH